MSESKKTIPKILVQIILNHYEGKQVDKKPFFAPMFLIGKFLVRSFVVSVN